jgi:Mn2+/Fe2+ NRAMP family transporter
VVFNFLNIDPMKALYWTAVINGLLAPPLMVMTLLVARNPRVMGRLVLPLPVAALGWVATGVMVLAGVGFW